MSVPAVILDTVLARLAPLFLTGAQGNETTARHAAAQMLAAYRPDTEIELHLAANIISFSFHALEALEQAAGPDLPLPRVLRLRGSAVSLSRESHKAERHLEHLQQCRQAGVPPAREPATQPSPTTQKALDLIADTRAVSATALRTRQTWTQAYHQRERDRRLAKRAAKQQTTATHATVM
jgi:hypothetical protein